MNPFLLLCSPFVRIFAVDSPPLVLRIFMTAKPGLRLHTPPPRRRAPSLHPRSYSNRIAGSLGNSRPCLLLRLLKPTESFFPSIPTCGSGHAALGSDRPPLLEQATNNKHCERGTDKSQSVALEDTRRQSRRQHKVTKCDSTAKTSTNRESEHSKLARLRCRDCAPFVSHLGQESPQIES